MRLGLIRFGIIFGWLLALGCGDLGATTLSISDGASSFSVNDSSIADDSFRQGGGTSVDHLYQESWHLNAGGSVTTLSGGTLTGSGSSATLTYASPGGGIDSVSVTYSIQERPAGTFLSVSTTITAGAGGATADLFNYFDYDIGSSSGNDSATYDASQGLMTITDGSSTINVLRAADNPDGWEVLKYDKLQDRILAGRDLRNRGAPFSNGDFTGAFQWNIDLVPNETRTITSVAAFGPGLTSAVPEPSTALALGGIMIPMLMSRRRKGKAAVSTKRKL